MEKITLREFAPADRKMVLHLFHLNTPRFFSKMEEKDLIEYLDHHLDHFYIVEINGQGVGCGGFNLFPEHADARISWDIFHPEFQGRGLGSALLQYRIDRITEVPGIKTITVRTSQWVYPFYEKFGFEFKERVKDYWAEGFDLYRMVRPL